MSPRLSCCCWGGENEFISSLSLLNSCTVAEAPAGGKSTHLSALSQSEAGSWGVGGTKEKERENHRAEIKSKEKRAETRLRGEEREQQLLGREGGEGDKERREEERRSSFHTEAFVSLLNFLEMELCSEERRQASSG